jgi:benzodiazapine receptor
MTTRGRNIIRIVLAIAICEYVGALGSLFTAPAVNGWYAGLTKPSFNPQNFVFAPVWTSLFALMGVALYLVWQKRDPQNRFALTLFGIQLGLNLLWSIIFFGLHSLSGAAWEIVLLWIAVLLTLVSFWKISRAAAYLLVPYLAWVSFAAVLTFSIWRLN